MAEEPKTKIEKSADAGDGATAVESTIAKSDEILTLLKGLGDRLTVIENKIAKEDEKPPKEEETEEKEEDEEEDETEKKSAVPAPDIEAVVAKAVAKALNKRMKDKEPDTPRPELKKHELKSPLEGMSSDKLAKMSIREIDAIVDGVEERPW